MRGSKRFFVVAAGCALLSCGHSQTEPEAQAAPPGVPPEVSAPAAEAAALPGPPVKEESAAPVRTAKSGPADQVWVVKKGKIAGHWPRALLLGKFKNKKLPGFTSDICYNFGSFAVVETKSTGEMGSAEIVLRHEPQGLCTPGYKGRYSNLRIIEGHFAGIAGDYLVVDGDDKTEGDAEFQIFDTATGKEVFKARRNPDEEFSLARKNGQTSVTFYSKIKVLCELANEGETCWKKVLAQNGVKARAPMPDCKKVFEQAKIQLFEPALVTMRARVADLKAPKVEFTGGRSTCAPAPP